MNQLNTYDLQFAVKRLPRDIRDMLKREGSAVFVAGGFIRSVITNEPINDIDIFVRNKGAAHRISDMLAEEGHTPFFSDNAITLMGRTPSVQFIHRWIFERPEHCIESFDFTIAKAAIWWDGKIWCSLCDPLFYADLAAKRLTYTMPQRNEDAGGSILRVLKFYQRGYRIPLEDLGAVIARLIQGIDAKKGLDLTDEKQTAKVLTGLLREVDPNIDPAKMGHFEAVD